MVSAVPSDVDDFLFRLVHPMKREILALRSTIRRADPRIKESIKWNAPSFSTSDHFATFQLRHRQGVQVVLHLGMDPQPEATLRENIVDPGILDWRGADRATVTFLDLVDVDAKRDAFTAILRQWIAFVG